MCLDVVEGGPNGGANGGCVENERAREVRVHAKVRDGLVDFGGERAKKPKERRNRQQHILVVVLGELARLEFVAILNGPGQPLEPDKSLGGDIIRIRAFLDGVVKKTNHLESVGSDGVHFLQHLVGYSGHSGYIVSNGSVEYSVGSVHGCDASGATNSSHGMMIMGAKSLSIFL